MGTNGSVGDSILSSCIDRDYSKISFYFSCITCFNLAGRIGGYSPAIHTSCIRRDGRVDYGYAVLQDIPEVVGTLNYLVHFFEVKGDRIVVEGTGFSVSRE